MSPTLTQQTTPLTQATAHVALMGWSGDAIEGMKKAGRSFLAVVPPEFAQTMEQAEVPYETWDFGTVDERGKELATRLQERGIGVAVPLYEETVAWAGYVNSHLTGDPRSFRRSMLFRDKGMMKRMAQLHDLRVGLFEEVEDKTVAKRFFHRVQDALVKLDTDEPIPVHIKPLDAAGAYGHKMLRTESDIDAMQDDDFPSLMESHLHGQEFSCEIFVHAGKIRFLNITEYVRLGYSNFIPASPSLEAHRPAIEAAAQKLIDATGLRHGMLHPEFFVDEEGTIRFGEVAARVPGGHIFELIHRAYGFDPYVAKSMCWDPDTSDEELDAFFPTPVEGADKVAGCLMVYPRKDRIEGLDIPQELEDEPYFAGHTLVAPLPGKVPDREAFGNHFGTVFFEGEDPDRMRGLLQHYENVDFYA